VNIRIGHFDCTKSSAYDTLFTALGGECSVPENIHTPPTEEIGISWEMGGSVRPKNLKKCMKLNQNFLRSGGGLRKIPFRGGGMDIFWNYTIQHF